MSSKKIGVKLGKVDKSDRYLQVFSYTDILGVLLLNVYKAKNILSEKKRQEKGKTLC